MKKNKKQKIKKSHGFTLIEVLVTILIIGIISTIGYVSFSSITKNTKDNTKIIAMKSLKTAAELYSKEQNDKIKWITKYENYKPIEKYICTTVQDLINAGYFKEDFYKSDNYENKITENTLIEIHKSNNYSDVEVIIHDTNVDMNQCLSSAMNQNLKDIKINSLERYTDRSYFNIADDNNSNLDYGVTYVNKDNERITSKCTNNKCTLTNLAPYNTYPFTLCPNGESTKSCKKLNIQTYDLEKPTINISPLTTETTTKDINIYFYNTNIYNGGYNYFKSEIDATSNQDVYKCASETNVTNNNCQTTTKTKDISAGSWYLTKLEYVRMITKASDTIPNNPKVYAKTKDESKNTKEAEEIIRNLKANTYVKIRFKPNGGSVTSQTTASNGTVYNWSVGSSDGLLYLNGKIHEQKIAVNGSLGSNGLVNYDNPNYLYIKRFGYKVPADQEWICLEGCNKTYNQRTAYQASDFCDASNSDCTVTLGVNWKRNFTCARSESETTYMGKKWYTINNSDDTCELALKETVGSSTGNKYTDATGTGTGSVYSYIKDFTNGTNTLATEYEKGLITTIDTNVTETNNKKNQIDGAYWVSDGEIYDSSSRTSSVATKIGFYTSAMPHCSSGTNGAGEACSTMPKVRYGYSKTETTTVSGYRSLLSSSTSQSFSTVGNCSSYENGAKSTDWTRGHASSGDTKNLVFTYVLSGSTSITTSTTASKSYRFAMCGLNNSGYNYDNSVMLIFKPDDKDHYSYTNWHMYYGDGKGKPYNTPISYSRKENYIFAGQYSIGGKKDVDQYLYHTSITGCTQFCTSYPAGATDTVYIKFRPHIIVKK